MGAMIYFSSLLILAFLTLSGQARIFPAGGGKAVVIIYGRSASSLHLDLSAILSAAMNNDIMVEAPVRPKPKPVPSPKPASPISELTSTDDDGIITMVTQGRKVLTPPPPPKPASPTHYIAPHHERSPPAQAGGYYYSSSS
ncbi:hypothetical protein LINGRAHAP2_LOCUS31592 [Linum grandiflorum]